MNRLSVERAEELLEGMRGVRILVVGDVMLDVYLRGGASRISPEAPVPVVRIEEDWRALGGAANVAANVVALGARCELIGMVGRDRAGEELRQALAESGVESGRIVEARERPTTVKTRVLVRHQQVARYDHEVDDDLAEPDVAALVAAVEAAAGEADAIALEDYDKGALVPPVIDAALDAGRGARRPVVVDPKARHFFEYRGASLFKPNLAELTAALRAPVLVDDEAWMRRTRRHLDCANLLVTLGEQGLALTTEAGEHVRVPAVARSVYDVSGAGDTVTAVLALALAARATAPEAAVLANHAAGIEVGKAGVATVSPDEILDSVRRWSG